MSCFIQMGILRWPPTQQQRWQPRTGSEEGSEAQLGSAGVAHANGAARDCSYGPYKWVSPGCAVRVPHKWVSLANHPHSGRLREPNRAVIEACSSVIRESESQELCGGQCENFLAAV